MSYCGNDKHTVEERCRRMAYAVNDRGWPITFDEQMGEYNLATTMFVDGISRDAVAMLHFCPWCGGKLPEPKRGEFFTTPSDVDEAAANEALRGVKDLITVIDKLGPPTDEGTGGGAESDPWIKWIRYMHKWETLVLVIGEHADGRLSWCYAGQYIGSPESDES